MSHTRAVIKKLKVQLKNPKKDRTLSTYLFNRKKDVDNFSSVGAPIYANKHIEVILDCLVDEYNPYMVRPVYS